MRCNWSHVSLGWRGGCLDNMAKEAIEIAKLLDTKVNFEFNGVKVNVSKYSDWEDVVLKTSKAMKDGKTNVYGEGV